MLISDAGGFKASVAIPICRHRRKSAAEIDPQPETVVLKRNSYLAGSKFISSPSNNRVGVSLHAGRGRRSGRVVIATEISEDSVAKPLFRHS